MFSIFDFSVLDDPSFKEDSVREELVAPMLRALGYTPSPPNQILRSVGLVHPYVYIGTKKYPINIIPDYLLKRDGANFMIIDAKAPNEEIHRGKNVEQAYSYAIHRDVRVQLFALCNGREFTLFHVSRWPEILTFEMHHIDSAWEILARTIGTASEWKKVAIRPDLGLHMLRLGLAFDKEKVKVAHLFTLIDIHMVARLDDSTYSINSHIAMDEQIYLTTFDFDKSLFPKFISCIEPKEAAEEVSNALSHYPFKWLGTPPDKFAFVGVACRIGDNVHKNENEDYCPFTAFDFI